MKRGGPLRRRTALPRSSGLFRSTPIPATSTKRRQQQRTYRVLRAEFLDARPTCENPLGCPNGAVEVHHMRGRVGGDFLDVSRWLALCSKCHRYATENPATAIAVGLSERRIGGAA